MAINALARVLRDPGATSQHAAVVGALSAIFRSLGLAAVPYLPKVGGQLGGWLARGRKEVISTCGPGSGFKVIPPNQQRRSP